MTQKFSLIVFIAVAVACASSCERRKPAAPAPQQKSAEVSPTRSVGGEYLGFVDFLERDGRFVVMHQFLKDTNGDGRITAELGDHGEPEGDLPVVVVEDLRTGERSTYDELIAQDPRGRFVVVRSKAALLLVRAGDVVTLPDADPRADANPCMPARQATIGPAGRWLVYMRHDPDLAVVRNVATAEEREVPAVGKLWRADAAPLGWVVMREVQEDTTGDDFKNWPRLSGSCVCRWCARFAKSVGRGGKYEGDDVVSSLVDLESERWSVTKPLVPVAPGFVWSVGAQRLLGEDSEAVDVGPEDACRAIAIPFDTGKLVTRCGRKTFVWDPVSDDAVEVQSDVSPFEVFSEARGGRIPVRVTDADGRKHVGRLVLESGAVEMGPRALRVGPIHPSGWVLVADAANTHAFHVETGATSTIPRKGTRLAELAFGGDEKWYVVDPDEGTTVRLKSPPRYVASNGCFIEPHDQSRPVQGPLTWRCP